MKFNPLCMLLVTVIGIVAAPRRAAAQTCPCTNVNTCNGECGGSMCCNFGCTDYATDPFNCGSCGRDCGPMTTCVGGTCTCVPGDVRTWCYNGPPGTRDVGVCRAGTETCTATGTWGPCVGAVTPTSEQCNGLDDDCDGRVDNVPGSSAPLSRPCYSGPPGTSGVGSCHGGTAVCTSGTWGACLGEVVPDPGAPCGSAASCTLDCPDAGVVDAGIDAGATDASTADASTTDAGEPPIDAAVPDAGCVGGGSCYDGPPGTDGVGVCHGGVTVCEPAGLVCEGQVLPTAPLCGAVDHDCNGAPDVACPNGRTCDNGVCVPGCPPDPDGVPRPCPTGYQCVAGECSAITCPDALCPLGQICVAKVCMEPCSGACAANELCFNDSCIPATCESLGCLQGYVCIDGGCRPDPCANVTCAATELCRLGTCVAACAFVNCAPGESCGADGACHADPCVGVNCSPGSVCVDGICQADACQSVVCPPAQICRNGACVADPCESVHCPPGTMCELGQCYGTDPGDADAGVDAGALPTDAAPTPPPSASTDGCGCRTGTGGREGMALVALLGLLGMIRRGREKT